MYQKYLLIPIQLNEGKEHTLMVQYNISQDLLLPKCL